jgi:6-phosphogluconolactonase (cycloisomerase 2 family)
VIRRWSPALVALAVVVGAVVVLVAGGTSGAATGDLTPRGCIDDNDFGTDPQQGEDNCADSTNGLHAVLDLVISPDGESLYAISEDDNAVSRFRRNTDTGALTPRGCIDDTEFGVDNCGDSTGGLERPGAIDISPDGKYVYVVTEGDNAIVRFRRDPQTGALTPRGCIEDNEVGDSECADTTTGLLTVSGLAMSPNGKSLYTTSEGDEAITRFKRDTQTGALTPKGCIEDNEAEAVECADSTVGLESVTSVVVSPDGESVYAASEHDSALVRFNRDTGNGALTPRGCIEDDDFAALECARTGKALGSAEGIVISKNGKTIYVASEGDSAVSRFHRNPDNGAITFKGCTDDNDLKAPECGKHTNGLAEASALALSPDGASLYVAAGTDDAIAIFKVDKQTGALTARGCIDDNDFGTDPEQGEDNCARSVNGLRGVEGIAVSPDDRSFYAPAEEDDAIVTFKRATG